MSRFKYRWSVIDWVTVLTLSPIVFLWVFMGGVVNAFQNAWEGFAGIFRD